MQNKYVKRARISEQKFREIVKYFALDLQANQIAQITGLSRNSINAYIKALRIAILKRSGCKLSSFYLEEGSILLGVVYQHKKVELTMLPATLYPQIWQMLKGKKIDPQLEEFRHKYVAVIDLSRRKFYQIDHILEESHKHHMMEATSFWGYVKMRLAKFRGISKNNILLHIKESEFRYNHRDEDLYKLLLKFLRENPLTFK